jgi:hypothetical protein
MSNIIVSKIKVSTGVDLIQLIDDQKTEERRKPFSIWHIERVDSNVYTLLHRYNSLWELEDLTSFEILCSVDIDAVGIPISLDPDCKSIISKHLVAL